MARRNLKFKERDVSRAIRGVAKAGVPIGRVVVTRDGDIQVIASQPGDVIETSDDLDRELAKFEAGHGEAGR